MLILGRLFCGILIGSCTCQNCSVVYMWLRKCAWYRDVPSERESLLSDPDRPTGSFAAGIWALLTAFQIISLRLECHWCVAVLFRQERPCSPLATTVLPQGHVWGSHVIAPNLVPTEMRIISSLSRKPTAVIGGAFSQAPEWPSQAERRRARSVGVSALAKKSAWKADAAAPSHTFCMARRNAGGVSVWDSLV